PLPAHSESAFDAARHPPMRSERAGRAVGRRVYEFHGRLTTVFGIDWYRPGCAYGTCSLQAVPLTSLPSKLPIAVLTPSKMPDSGASLPKAGMMNSCFAGLLTRLRQALKPGIAIVHLMK